MTAPAARPAATQRPSLAALADRLIAHELARIQRQAPTRPAPNGQRDLFA